MQRIVISIFDSVDNPHYGGGGAWVVRRVAERLASQYEVTVVAAAFPGSRPGVRRGVRYRYLPLGWAGPRAGQLLFHAALPFVVRTTPHDLWIESFTPPFSTSFVPAFTRRPVIGLIQFLSGGPMSARYHLPFHKVERCGLRLYGDVVTLNETDAEVVRAVNPAARVTVTGNGVDPPPEEEVAYGSGDYVLYLGRLDVTGKGLDLLLSAQARTRHPLPLLIAGTGPAADRTELRRLAARHPGRVELLGAVHGQRKEQLLRDCAYLVMPSRFETFGLVALEAMSHGKPVIHFDLPQLRWTAGGAVRVAPFDDSALAREMDRLATDVNARYLLGCAARGVAESHRWDVVVDRYRELVSEVLSRAAGKDGERAA